MRFCVVLVALAACGRLGFDEIDPSGPPPDPPSGSGRIAAGRSFTCAIKQDHTTWCWGSSSARELGRDALDLTAVPTQANVPPLAQIAAGDQFACGIDLDGAAWCWGANDDGQLAQGAFEVATAAVRVALPRPVASLALGARHACAVLDDQSLWCWGENADHQVSPDQGDIASPIQAMAGVAQVVAGDFHTCALRTDGATLCWGANYYGELGTATGDHAMPERVSIDAFRLIGGSDHVCALVAGGRYACWGNNANGQLGIETAQSVVELPQAPSTETGYADGSGGDDVTCAIRATGAVDCWGNGNRGEVGQGNGFDTSVPHAVALTGKVIGVSAGGRHVCVIRDDDSAACWGSGSSGELGDGRHAALVPTKVTLPGTAQAIATGFEHACASVGGAVYCWGNNSDRQLGNDFGTDFLIATPTKVPELAGASTLALGRSHSCAASDAKVTCWGGNASSQLGVGTSSYAEPPTVVAGLTPPIARLSAGGDTTCAIANAQLTCWGRDDYGQQGDGGGNDVTTPRLVSQGAWTDVGLGEAHGCAIDSTGKLSCWGYNADGQTGDGTTGVTIAPLQPVASSGTFSVVRAASDHTCAVNNNGRAQCWGANGSGQLGDGTFDNHPLPTDTAINNGGVLTVAAAGRASCAITNGAVRCWGANFFGQLGDGTTTGSPTPTTAAVVNPVKVELGIDFACALDSSGGVWCWGDNWAGQLGLGTTTTALAPVAVAFP